MSRWFRHYAGMMRDEKLVRVAVRSKQPVHLVVWVWGAILESAAEINDGGRYEFDALEAAYFLRTADDDIEAILVGLSAAEHVADGRVVKWSERQHVSDNSAERQRRYRERRADTKVHENRDSDVTRPSRDVSVTPPEAETETDSYTAETRARAIDVRMPELCAALGVTDETKTPGLLSFSEPIQWVTAGCDIDADILPALRAIAARGKTPKSWRYCSDAVFEARDRRLAPPPAVRERGGTGPPRNDLDRMNAALDSLISGQPNEPDLHLRTIDASFERRDWGGSEGAVQRHAIPARN